MKFLVREDLGRGLCERRSGERPVNVLLRSGQVYWVRAKSPRGGRPSSQNDQHAPQEIRYSLLPLLTNRFGIRDTGNPSSYNTCDVDRRGPEDRRESKREVQGP